MGAKDFLRHNLPYAIEKENGEWIVKNRDYEKLGVCHLPEKEIIKAAYSQKEDADAKVVAIYLYDDKSAPNLRGVPSHLDEEKWQAYCNRLKILVTKKPELKKKKGRSIRP